MRPFVSVIITTYNAADTIEACLKSLVYQSYPRDRYEIIVVDAGSDDATVKIAKKLCNRVVVKPGANRALGRQTGIDMAQGELILFIDADCIAKEDWIEKMVRNYPKYHCVGGIVKAAVEDTIVNKFESWRIGMFFSRRKDSVDYIATWNAMFSKKLLLEVGGFDTRMGAGEDIDLCIRAREAGYTIYLEREAVVYHHHRSTLLSLIRQNISYGQSTAILMKKHRFRLKLLLFYLLNILSLLNLFILAMYLLSGWNISYSQIITLFFPLITVMIFDPYSLQLSLDVFLYGDPAFIFIPVLEYIRTLSQSYGFFKGLIRPDTRIFTSSMNEIPEQV